MRVTVDVLRPVGERYLLVRDEHVLVMMLRHGAIEVGVRPSAKRRVTFQAGEMGFFPRQTERWVGTGEQERLLLHISDAALMTACNGMSSAAGLGHRCQMVDARLAPLMAAVNAEELRGSQVGACCWIRSSRRLL